MFALVAGPPNPAHAGHIAGIAARLRASAPARMWCDSQARGGAAAGVAGTLPEDVFDRQPLVDDDLVFVCRARLDNRAALASALGLAREDAAIMADSAMLQGAYRRWGDDCVHHVTGDFAFIAWRPRAATLTAAIDHSGTVRLYWALADGGIAISGELGALLAHPGVSDAPDLAALARMLDAGLDRASTPFAAVRALTGGHWLRWAGGEVQLERWWNPEVRPVSTLRTAAEHSEQTLELLDRAVAALSRTAGGLSTTLSGGLDSGLVTALVARQNATRGGRILAYTTVPECGLPVDTRRNWEADDGPYAAEVAALYPNIRHITVPPGGRSAIDLMPALFATERAPMKSISNLIWIDAISRASVDAGSPVILNGGMGNATISWTGAGGVGELLRGRRLRAAIDQARGVAADDGRPLWRLLATRLKQSVLAGRRRRLRGPSTEFLRREHRPPIEGRHGAFADHRDARAAWLAFAITPRTTWMPDMLAQHGADWRDPTVDRTLVETLLTYPLAAFAPGGVSRGLARAVGSGLLPDSVRLRRTRGAQVPEQAALIARDGVRYAAVIEAMSGSPACVELLDLAALHAALGRIRAGDPGLIRAGGFERAFGVGHFLLALENSRHG